MWTNPNTSVSVKLGLRKGPRLVRGSLTDEEQVVVAQVIVRDLQLNNWKFEKGRRGRADYILCHHDAGRTCGSSWQWQECFLRSPARSVVQKLMI